MLPLLSPLLWLFWENGGEYGCESETAESELEMSSYQEFRFRIDNNIDPSLHSVAAYL